MGVWLIQTGQSHAHLYPDDDSETKAACGFVLEDDCECCGRPLETTTPRKNIEKCVVCLESDSK